MVKIFLEKTPILIIPKHSADHMHGQKLSESGRAWATARYGANRHARDELRVRTEQGHRQVGSLQPGVGFSPLQVRRTRQDEWNADMAKSERKRGD